MSFEFGPVVERYPLQLIFLIVIAVTWVREAWCWRVGRQSVRWARATARVDHISIRGRYDEDNQPAFYSRIAYSYVFNGRRYRSTRVSYNGVVSSSYDAAMEPWTGIVAGSSIDIRVDPDKPSRAVIFPGYNASGFLYMAILAALVVWLTRHVLQGATD